MSLEWDPAFIADLHAGKYDWVAYLYCPRCGCTWRGLLRDERPGVFGPVPEQCPDCDEDEDSDGS